MVINELLRGVDCICGKHHACSIEAVYIERNAAQRLTQLCRDSQNILIVADENTFRVGGEAVLAALAGKNIRKQIFAGKEILVPNEAAIEAVRASLGDTELIVGIGSGVIQDLCKYTSFYRQLPYIIVATAPSMDGYASSGAAMITDGMKVTYPVGLPRAILGDTEVLANAPMEMIQAGYGDIVGKFSSLNDWKLSHLVQGEYFCPYIYNLTYEQVTRTIDLAGGLLRRDEDSIRTLMEALILVGILISFAGSSRPASGSEHHLSHFFEITGILTGSPYFAHGIDVAYSAVITAMLREEILKHEFPDALYRESREAYEGKMHALYKTSAAGCMALQEKMGRYRDMDIGIYKAKEAQIRSILAEMPTAGQIEEILGLARLDMGEFYALYGREKLLDAVLYAKDLKDRYTVLWLYYDLFGSQAK